MTEVTNTVLEVSSAAITSDEFSSHSQTIIDGSIGDRW